MDRIQIASPSFGEEELIAIQDPIKTGWLTQGKYVKEFEDNFAAIHDVKYALATSSCTTALHLMLAAAGIGPGDEVILPSFTWVSTANSVLYCGATPILVDIDLDTFNISLEETLKKVTPRTKAVIAVDLFGLCVDIKLFKEKLGPDILVFEDAACAAGASLNGNMAGTLSDAAAFSFHPRKSITTGEGGMLTTQNSKLAKIAEKMRNHGAEISEEERHNGPAPYLLPEFNLLGFNYRMTDLQGAVGVEQLKKLDKFIEEREEQANYYNEKLSDITWLSLPSRPSNSIHAWQAYVTRVVGPSAADRRNKVMEHLELNGIATRPGTHAIHLLGFYATKFRFSPNDFPNSLLSNETSMAIPLHNRLSRPDQDRVIDSLISMEFK
jgi:perosamine synthetase